MKATNLIVFSLLYAACFSSTNAYGRDSFYDPFTAIEMDGCQSPVNSGDTTKKVNPEKDFYNTGDAVEVTSKESENSLVFFKYRLICKNGAWEENNHVGATVPGCKPPNVIAYNSFTEHHPEKESYDEGDKIQLKLNGALKFEGYCKEGTWELKIPSGTYISIV